MFSPAQNTSYEEMSLHAKGLIVSWALNNRGIVVDDWKKRAVEREDKWKDLSRYTLDTESGKVKEWEVAIKEREARESYWNYAPDVGKIRGYIPAVPGMRGASRPLSSAGGGDDAGANADSDSEAFDEAVAKTAQDSAGVENAQATSFWSRYLPSSSTASKPAGKRKLSNDAPAVSTDATATPPAFTSYFWSADNGVSAASSDNKDEPPAPDAAASQSWLSYGYSYLPTGRGGSRPSTPAQKSESQSQSQSEPEVQAGEHADAQSENTSQASQQPKTEMGGEEEGEKDDVETTKRTSSSNAAAAAAAAADISKES